MPKNEAAEWFLCYKLDACDVFAVEKAPNYGGRSSVVERLVVVQDVVGSIPIGRPTFLFSVSDLMTHGNPP